MTTTQLQPSWPCTVNTWIYPQLLPVGLNLGGLEQGSIEAGGSAFEPDYYQGLDVPPGDRLATVDSWTFTVTGNSFATKGFLFIQAEPGWMVTTDGPSVADDGAGNFGIGCTSMSPPAGPGLPTGTTVITVTPVGLDMSGFNEETAHLGLYGFGMWHFTVGGANSTFTAPAAADITFESFDVTYTTEADPAQEVWHAIVAGDGFVAGGLGATFDLADAGSIPQPIPCDIDAGEAIKWVSIDVEAGGAGDLRILQNGTIVYGTLVFEDTPDEVDVIVPAASPTFDVGAQGLVAFGAAVTQRANWMFRSPQDMSDRTLFSFSPGLPITSLDVWYERQLDPPVAIFTAIPDNGPSPLHVDFDASASYDPTATCYPSLGIVSYEWDFNYDGFTFIPQPPSGVTSMHLYTIPGVYLAALRVTDGDGQTDIATATIIVGNPTSRWKVGQIGMGVPS